MPDVEVAAPRLERLTDADFWALYAEHQEQLCAALLLMPAELPLGLGHDGYDLPRLHYSMILFGVLLGLGVEPTAALRLADDTAIFLMGRYVRLFAQPAGHA